MNWVEIQILSADLEVGLGFTASNYELITDLDFSTRGGANPFILAIDANALPEEWDHVWWGEKKFLEHMKAEVVQVKNSRFTCVNSSSEE